MKHVRHDETSIGFRDILRIRIFSVLFAAESQSIAGDQIARIALSVLAFDATGSALATALTYAATLLPVVVGGFTLGRLGDRFSRRGVMICSDLIRAACFAAMAMDAVPLVAVVALLVVAGLVSPMFTAAETSYLAQSLTPEEYRVGTALRLMTSQAAQVGGLALGGVVTALLDPRYALLLDAITFVVSAALVTGGIRRAGAGRARAVADGPTTLSAGSVDTFTGLWADARARRLLLLTLVVGFFVVPEGLAVPFGRSIAASTAEIGLLLSGGAAGAVVGSFGLVRYVAAARRDRVAARMAAGCGLPLVVPAVVPHWLVALACWALSGLLSAYVLETTTALIQAVPAGRRSYYSGVINALLLSAQGLAIIAFGALGGALSPKAAIAIAGLTGAGLAFVIMREPRSSLDRPVAQSPDVIS